jgi:hypothetical protein
MWRPLRSTLGHVEVTKIDILMTIYVRADLLAMCKLNLDDVEADLLAMWRPLRSTLGHVEVTKVDILAIYVRADLLAMCKLNLDGVEADLLAMWRSQRSTLGHGWDGGSEVFCWPCGIQNLGHVETDILAT